MNVLIEESKQLRRASASIREGGHILVKVPKHWPKHLKASVADELVDRIKRKDAQEKKWMNLAKQQALITLETNAELTAFVAAINQETFQVPLGKVQIGWAKYHHLAQLNLRTKTMTVSRYCLNQAPVEALRYLIVHELAHYFESGHGPRFWKRVQQYVPDYKVQSKIMKAFHHQAVIADSELEPNSPSAAAESEQMTPIEQKTVKPLASLPSIQREKALIPSQAVPQQQPKRNQTSPWAGLIKQLQFWD